jgi:hypothetical protein
MQKHWHYDSFCNRKSISNIFYYTKNECSFSLILVKLLWIFRLISKIKWINTWLNLNRKQIKIQRIKQDHQNYGNYLINYKWTNSSFNEHILLIITLIFIEICQSHLSLWVHCSTLNFRQFVEGSKFCWFKRQ